MDCTLEVSGLDRKTRGVPGGGTRGRLQLGNIPRDTLCNPLETVG